MSLLRLLPRVQRTVAHLPGSFVRPFPLTTLRSSSGVNLSLQRFPIINSRTSSTISKASEKAQPRPYAHLDFETLSRQGVVAKIARVGHPVLLEKCTPVQDPTSQETQAIVAHMCATLADMPSFLGLSAPQIHIAKRIIVYRVPPEFMDMDFHLDEDQEAAEKAYNAQRSHSHSHSHGGVPCGAHHEPTGVPPTVLINPEIEPVGAHKSLAFEGCFSFPQLVGEVRRYDVIKYRGYGLDGKLVQGVAKGAHARILQHEFDHMDGILFTSKLTNPKRFGFQEEVIRAQEYFADKGEEVEVDVEEGVDEAATKKRTSKASSKSRPE